MALPHWLYFNIKLIINYYYYFLIHFCYGDIRQKSTVFVKLYLKLFSFIVWFNPRAFGMNQSAFLLYVPGSYKGGQGFLQFGCKALKPLLTWWVVWSCKWLHGNVGNTLDIQVASGNIRIFKKERALLNALHFLVLFFPLIIFVISTKRTLYYFLSSH